MKNTIVWKVGKKEFKTKQGAINYAVKNNISRIKKVTYENKIYFPKKKGFGIFN